MVDTYFASRGREIPSPSRRYAIAGFLACLILAGSGLWSALGAGVSMGEGIYLVGKIKDKNISESSGLVASRQHPGILWTHNDRGNTPILFGIDRRGRTVSHHRIKANLKDWEDLAIDKSGHLYIGDLGNNNAARDELSVYQIEEPDPEKPDNAIVPQASWTLRFPSTPFDCESLFIQGTRGFVISKVTDDARGGVYSFALGITNASQMLSLVTTLPITSPVTGADLSSDDQLLGVVCKAGAYVFFCHGDIASAGQAKFHRNKFKKGQIEGCCFVPEGLLASSEGQELFLFTDPAYQVAP